MTDKRELILSRLFEVLKAIPGTVSVTRNEGELPDKRRPAIVLLDGDEMPDERAFDRGRPAYGPNLVIMTPQIFLLLNEIKEKRKRDDLPNEGTELNSFRVLAIKAILTDQVLANLVGSNGSIRYMGCISEYATGRGLLPEMQISVVFIYVLDPLTLTDGE